MWITEWLWNGEMKTNVLGDLAVHLVPFKDWGGNAGTLVWVPGVDPTLLADYMRRVREGQA